MDKAHIKFMDSYKQGQMHVDAGTQVLVQGAVSPHLYTILNGVFVRHRLLEDGRRQIVNFMFPGDLVGLQGARNDPLCHSVEALTDGVLCVFSKDRLPELYREAPELAFDLTWLAAKEEAALEEHLVSLGQRRAKERLVYLALFLVKRAQQSGMATRNGVKLTVTQAQIAETMGLSLVHVNRTLQTLRKEGLVNWSQNRVDIPDMEAAEAYVGFEEPSGGCRPFI